MTKKRKIKTHPYTTKGKPLTMMFNGIPVHIGVEKHCGNWSVYVWIGVQGFHMSGLEGAPKCHAEFRAKMLRKAFKQLKKGEG